MMGIVITTYTDSLSIDLGGLSSERKFARIKYNYIRSITKSTDDKTVSIIFTNGEIYGFSYELVDEVDGDTNITSQDILYNKIEPKLFA